MREVEKLLKLKGLSEQVRGALETIEKYSDVINNVEDLACNEGWSREHFSRVFKAETGMTPADLIRQTRAEAAHDKLKFEFKVPTETIQKRVGFGCVTSMRNALHHYFGKTPGEIRDEGRRAMQR